MNVFCDSPSKRLCNLVWNPAHGHSQAQRFHQARIGLEIARHESHVTAPCEIKRFAWRTAEERPCTTIEHPVVMEDLHATIYHTLGISPRLSYEIEQRPFYVTRDGLGKPVTEVLAS